MGNLVYTRSRRTSLNQADQKCACRPAGSTNLSVAAQKHAKQNFGSSSCCKSQIIMLSQKCLPPVGRVSSNIIAAMKILKAKFATNNAMQIAESIAATNQQQPPHVPRKRVNDRQDEQRADKTLAILSLSCAQLTDWPGLFEHSSRVRIFAERIPA